MSEILNVIMTIKPILGALLCLCHSALRYGSRSLSVARTAASQTRLVPAPRALRGTLRAIALNPHATLFSARLRWTLGYRCRSAR